MWRSSQRVATINWLLFNSRLQDLGALTARRRCGLAFLAEALPSPHLQNLLRLSIRPPLPPPVKNKPPAAGPPPSANSPKAKELVKEFLESQEDKNILGPSVIDLSHFRVELGELIKVGVSKNGGIPVNVNQKDLEISFSPMVRSVAKPLGQALVSRLPSMSKLISKLTAL
jgi:hypothetical protein